MNKYWVIFKERYKKVRRKMVLNNYYTKEIKGGKTTRAALLDDIFLVLIIFLLMSLLLLKVSNNIILSTFTALVIVFFLAITLYKIKMKKRYKKIGEINDNIINKKIIRELSVLNQEDFIKYIKSFLEKYYSTTFFQYNAPIDLTGKVGDEVYVVKCLKISLEDRVTLKDIEDFKVKMNDMDVDGGIIITNSYFSDEVKEKSNLILMDLDKIKSILKEIKECPSETEIQDYILTRYKDKKRKIKSNITFFSKDKIYKFYILFLVLYGISTFVPYSKYYKIMALVAFILGTTIGGYNLTEYIRTKDDIHLHN